LAFHRLDEKSPATDNGSISGAMPKALNLVNARRPLPIDNANQVPRVPNEIHLQLPLLIDHKFGCRVQDTRALALVRVVQVEFASVKL